MVKKSNQPIAPNSGYLSLRLTCIYRRSSRPGSRVTRPQGSRDGPTPHKCGANGVRCPPADFWRGERRKFTKSQLPVNCCGSRVCYNLTWLVFEAGGVESIEIAKKQPSNPNTLQSVSPTPSSQRESCDSGCCWTPSLNRLSIAQELR